MSKMKSNSAFPPRADIGTLRQYSVEHILTHRGFGRGRPLLGFLLPGFQRSAVWSVQQQTRFMESLILGLPIGSYAYVEGYDVCQYMDGWLIDGQQRITAISQFVADKFPVFGLRWSELTSADIWRVKKQMFSAFVLRDPEESQAINLCKLLAYGGTPHRPTDKARVERALRTAKKRKTPTK